MVQERMFFYGKITKLGVDFRTVFAKDFACCDCGRAFYFQKNLFTHVVEAHGKSPDELPNLAMIKTEDGVIK